MSSQMTFINHNLQRGAFVLVVWFSLRCFMQELTWRTDAPRSLKWGAHMRWSWSQQYEVRWTVLVCNSPNVRHQWKDKGNALTWMNEGPLMVIAVSWSEGCFGGGSDSCTRWGMIVSLHSGEECWDPPPPHPPTPYPRWTPGVQQLPPRPPDPRPVHSSIHN